MDDTVVQAAIAEAEATGTPVAELTLERIAARAGTSRSTMFRRIGSRQALEDAVRQTGIDPGQRPPSVRDRAIHAATDLIVTNGIAALTVEAVARHAGCALTSVHTQCGGRAGLLAAVFEQHAPLPVVEHLFATQPEQFSTLADGVRAIYTVIMNLDDTSIAVIEALFAEALAKPDGVVMHMVQQRIVPGITQTVGAWLTTKLPTPPPPSVLLPLFIAPISIHLLVRKHLTAAGQPVPDPTETIDTMTNAFCRAVATNT